MKPIEPLELHHSWPIAESGQRFDLGWVHEGFGTLAEGMAIGTWACALANDALTWSATVYDIFGLPHGAAVSRAETLPLYAEESRSAMERLRAHGLRHRRGFTLDAEIVPATGGGRWMRLIAAPVCNDGQIVALHGLKQDVTRLYR